VKKTVWTLIVGLLALSLIVAPAMAQTPASKQNFSVTATIYGTIPDPKTKSWITNDGTEQIKNMRQVGLISGEIDDTPFEGTIELVISLTKDPTTMEGSGHGKFNITTTDGTIKGKLRVEVDWTPLSCALISRQAYQTVGLLDEAFLFVSVEELDFCIRAAKKGFKILFVPESNAWHDSEGPFYDERTRSLLEYYLPRNTLILMHKHWHGLQLITATLFFILSHVRSLIHFLLYSRNWNHFKLYLQGILDYLKWRRGHRQEKTLTDMGSGRKTLVP